MNKRRKSDGGAVVCRLAGNCVAWLQACHASLVAARLQPALLLSPAAPVPTCLCLGAPPTCLMQTFILVGAGVAACGGVQGWALLLGGWGAGNFSWICCVVGACIAGSVTPLAFHLLPAGRFLLLLPEVVC